jgi:GntR family transcriptional regulator
MAEPMYRQIADDLRRRIESGELRPGSQLPTELALRETYDNASRNTVRDAVKSLAHRGLVVTRPGQGTFVVDRIVPFTITMSTDPETGLGGGEGVAYMSEARARLRHPEATVPRVEIQSAPRMNAMIAEELQLDDGAQVVSRHQQLRIDGKPWSLQTSFYPMALVTLGAARLVEANNIEPGVVHYLGETLDLRQVGYQDKVNARAPDEVETSFFRLREGSAAVIETVRTAYDQSGKPLRCTVTVWAADRNRLVYNVGNVPEKIASLQQMDEPESISEPADGG